MLYALLCITLVCGTARAAFGKKIGTLLKRPPDLFFYNGVTFAVIFVIVFTAWLINITAVSWFTALWGLAFAAVMLAAQLFNMLALKDGAMGLCSFFYSCGFVIAAFAGVLFWDEPFFWSQIAGVALVAASFVPIVFLSKSRKKPVAREEGAKQIEAPTADGQEATAPRKKPKIWIVFALISMVASGILGVIQKIHQTSDVHKDELFAFLFISFAAASLIAFIFRFVAARRSKGAAEIEPAAVDITAAQKIPFCKSGLFFALLNGAVFGVVNILNTYLSGRLPSMIFFPVYNGGVIFAGLFTGLLVFKEKITGYDIIGLIIGVAGIILIALKPF